MKKKLIAASAASAVLAAMPVVGVFAAQVNSAVTDTISATLADSCSFTSAGKHENADSTGGAYEYAISSITAGAPATIGSTVMTIKCNKSGGWSLQAVGAGTAEGDVTKMDSGNNVDTEDIATGTATSGTTSNWAFKVATPTGYTSLIQSNYGEFSAVPATATAIVSSDAATDTATGVTVSPTYQVYISTVQASGTYTGKVSYTLIQPAA